MEDEKFYAVWTDMPTYCSNCHAEGHAVSNCPKIFMSYFVEIVVIIYILPLNAQKERIRFLKKEDSYCSTG